MWRGIWMIWEEIRPGSIGALLDQFTPDECPNYLRAAGYADSF